MKESIKNINSRGYEKSLKRYQISSEEIGITVAGMRTDIQL